MNEPFLKWAGGKRQLVSTLKPIIERHLRGVYIEPFLGGGALALALGESSCVVGDACEELINAWKVVQKQPKKLSKVLDAHREIHCPTHFTAVRSSHDMRDSVARAARTIYLNKTCFNGLYRVNGDGKFNVPIGRGDASSIPGYTELAQISIAIDGWQIVHSDFEALVDGASEGDVVFADPPYDGTHDYSSGFGDDDRRRLSSALRRAARRGAAVVVTDSDTMLTRQLYSWMDLREVSERRRVAARTDRREDAKCLVGVRP